MQVDRDKGIIYGVSVIALGEAKGHGVFIDKTTLEQVVSCASLKKHGVKVKVDHGSGLMSVVGHIRNARIEGDRVVGDLHLLNYAEGRDRILEMAETMPSEFGLSISFEGSDEVIGDQVFVRCHTLMSADLVDVPAANPNGLFGVRVNGRRLEFSVKSAELENEVDTEVQNMEHEHTDKQDNASKNTLENALETASENTSGNELDALKDRLAALESSVANLLAALESKEPKSEEDSEPEGEAASESGESGEPEDKADGEPEGKTDDEPEGKTDDVEELAACVARRVLGALGVNSPVPVAPSPLKGEPLTDQQIFDRKRLELGSLVEAVRYFQRLAKTNKEAERIALAVRSGEIKIRNL